MATSAINSISVRGILEGGDFFDENSFMEGSFGQSSLAGIAAGMAGYGVTSGLDSMITNSSLAGFSRKYFDGVRDLTGTMGALASAGVTYGLTGNATVNLLNTSMFSDNSSVGLFEVSFGEDGLHGAVGMDGTDLNLGKLVSSLNGASALFENSRIGDYASAHDLHAQVMLRTLYSYGDEAGREIYHDILSDNTKLSMSKNLDGNAEARTVVNEDGTKTVFLRSLSSDVASGVMAGIVLQHEAYRDGLTGSDQEAETFAAVTGHTEMALRIRDDGLYVNVITNNANLTRDIENHKSGTEAFRAYATSYDSSGDYWKLKLDGTIEWDGSKDLNVEYRDEEGNIHTKEGHIKDITGSFSQSLAQYIGTERAEQILGSSVNDLSLYDNQTLKDVFGMNGECVQAVRGNTAAMEAFLAGMSVAQREKMIGEALMKKSGMSWGSDGWTGGTDFTVAMTDVDNLGQIVINRNADGSYDRFGVSAVINRDVLSMYSLRKNNTSRDHQGLDTMTLGKRDLNGNVLDTNVTDGWQTVANGYTDGTRERQRAFTEDSVFRGATIAPDHEFYMRFGNFGGHDTFGGSYFIINRAQTVDGTFVPVDGNSGDRWLGHSNYLNKYNRSDNGGLISAGCFMNYMNTVNSVQEQLNNWGIDYTYDVQSVIRQETYEEEYWKWIY
jgi:hypothetical protein